MRDYFENIKDKIARFIEPYECDTDKFVDAWTVTSVPFMVLSQIFFFIFGYFEVAPNEEISSSWEILLNALWYGFGGLLVYICLSALMFILAAILNNRRVGIICIILGAIFTFFIYGAYL